jgi:hypothetical protein
VAVNLMVVGVLENFVVLEEGVMTRLIGRMMWIT